MLAAVPVLWVWDNVEPVTGFPAGSPSSWSDREQAELRTFLRDLRDRTHAKVLLTSRRDEHPWLGDLSQRVRLAPMPMWERLHLIHALASHLGAAVDTIDWRPLARFSGGNPLAIAVAVRQAVRGEHVTSTEQLEGFVARVEAGVAGLEPAQNAELGRSDSLAASLAYGFTHAFTPAEHTQLALLHLFRDTVDIDALRLMGDPQTAGDDAQSALGGADRDQLTALLDRATELGLLTGYGGGYYGIHPALPWFFTDLFTHHVPEPDAAARAYTHAHAALGNYYYYGHIQQGRATALLPVLRVQEANLRHALSVARTYRLPAQVIGCAQGLYMLYQLTGRDVEWTRLVAEFESDYIDPLTDGPRPGLEDHYSVLAHYRAEIARNRRDWPNALRLQTQLTVWNRNRALEYLDVPPEHLDLLGRHRLRDLRISEKDLGVLLLEQDNPACRVHFKIQYDLAEHIGDVTGQANAAATLGNAYLQVSGLRDLDRAQRWHQRGLDLKSEHDRIGRAVAHGALAAIAYQRFQDARAAGAPRAELAGHLELARAGYQQVRDLAPEDHHEYRAVACLQLGNVYAEVSDVPQSMSHYQQAIRHQEARGDLYGAGQTRFNIAVLLADHDRPGDALHYARAALTNYQQVGPGAQAEQIETDRLIQQLEQSAAAAR